MPAYGFSPAGFTVKPTSQILLEMQTAAWATIDPDLDLSAQTPDGQMLAIVANQAGAAWELLQVAANQYNREDVEGAGLDNLGDVIGVPREGESFTQVPCTLTIDAAHAPYAAGSLMAYVAGSPAFTFTNLDEVQAGDISGGIALGVVFESTVEGPTAVVNPGTLTGISTPVTGWTAITNPTGQSQLGSAEELDSAYAPRQAAEVAAEGACNPSATAAALQKLGAAQTPPVTLSVTVIENTTDLPVTVGGVITLPPHSYTVVIYENDAIGWMFTTAGEQAIGQVIYNNKPAGISTQGAQSVTITDPVLGQQTVFYSVPTGKPLFISAQVAVRAGQVFANIATAIRSALVSAAVAPNLANGVPPTGQLVPGGAVVGSQIEAVIMGVPGVFDVQVLTFDFSASPVNTSALFVDPLHIATIAEATVNTNVVLTAGTLP